MKRAGGGRWRRPSRRPQAALQAAHACTVGAEHGIVAALGEEVERLHLDAVAVRQITVWERSVDDDTVFAVGLEPRSNLLWSPRVAWDHAVDLVPAVPGALGNVDLHFCQATCKREQMAREDDLHLHVLGLEVNSKVEGAEQLLIRVVSRKLDCKGPIEMRRRRRRRVGEHVPPGGRVELVEPTPVLRKALMIREN